MGLTVILDVVDKNGKHSDYGNIVIAGTESLASSPNESYSLEVDTNGTKTPSLNIIETYVNNDRKKTCGVNCNAYNRPGAPAGSSWKDGLAVKAIVDSTATTKKMTINHMSDNEAWPPTYNDGDSHGDAIIAATDVHQVRATVKGGGKQHFAIGVLSTADFGDAPASYEDMNNPALHITNPVISKGDLPDGTYYFKGRNGFENFTNQDGTISSYGSMPTLQLPQLRIGSGIDFEVKPKNSDNADGDDTHQADDEDGVSTLIAHCDGQIKVLNEYNRPAYLHYWIDKNENGTFDNDEYVKQPVPATYFDTINNVKKEKTIAFPNNIFTSENKQERFMRFRITTEENEGVSGLAPDGEVEDVKVTFLNPRVQTGSHDLTCNDTTSPIEFTDLPDTGWTITGDGFTDQVCQ